MKLSIAIADTHALDSAFVVYRGFEKSIPKAAHLGYKGVELALKRAEEVNQNELSDLLGRYEMDVSCISTGQVYADGGLKFTDHQKSKRDEVKATFKEFIDLAESFGKNVNIGRIRGQIGERDRQEVEGLLIEVVQELCEYARPKGVTLLLEPVNRYECDFINTIEEGVALIQKSGVSNLVLMPDSFHMNIEEKGMGDQLARNIKYINYIHFADSNRLSPGQGHIDFFDLFDSLEKVEYDGWISIEILPKPTPDLAARSAIEFLMPFIDRLQNSKPTAQNDLRTP